MTETKAVNTGGVRRVARVASCVFSTRMVKKIVVNTGLILASALGGVVVCELILRFAFPKYEHLAASVLRMDQERIWANTPRSQITLRHPDTGKHHLVRHNDWALRQHRNIRPSSWRRQVEGQNEGQGKRQGEVHVGFFGDSMTENTLLPVQYSFTEPLDYLLNAAGRDRYNVLNFGVDGYGTEQSYLHYLNFKETDLDYVFYVFCFNDIEDISNTGLFRLDTQGELTHVAASQTHWLLRILSKLHITYLISDFHESLSINWAESARNLKDDLLTRYRRRSAIGFADAQQEESLRIFAAVLRRWKAEVEAAGGAFYVVFLPVETGTVPQTHSDVYLRAKRVVEQDVSAPIVDLLACAEELIPGFKYQTISFRNDNHWNEAGNMLAARCLYRFIERSSELPRTTETALTKRLHTYYSAFGDDGGQLPLAVETHDVQSRDDAEALASIRQKYLELDLRATDALGEAAQKARRAEPTVRAEWDVYALGDSLLYMKTNCQAEDTESRFFLHWVPVEGARDLPFAHVGQEFVQADFSFAARGGVFDGDCLAHVPVPPFSVASARTGQFEEIGEDEYRNIWQAHVPLGKP